MNEKDSDYVSEKTGQAAALWLIVYDDKNVGEEELEASEVHHPPELVVLKYHTIQVSGRNSGTKVLPNFR
jgi:hypothetical protein